MRWQHSLGQHRPLPDLCHPLRATQLFELQRLVLHRELVAALTFAVKPLEDF